MSEEMTPEQQMELQKANCPFCKIVKGEIPAIKVYEDEHMLAIQDINPLANGHTVLFPKEHVPIMQMMPKSSFDNMFSKLPSIVKGVKEGAVCDSVNVFVASGGVAGQQMPHFLLHIIPRENGDMIENFNKPPVVLSNAEVDKMLPVLKQNLNTMLQNDAKRTAPVSQPIQSNVDEPAHTISPEQKKLIAEFLESQDELRTLLLHEPNKFAEIIVQNEEVKNIFAGIDLVALSEKLKSAYPVGEEEQ